MKPVEPSADAALRASLPGILCVVCPALFVAALLARRIAVPGAGRMAWSILLGALVLSGLTAWWWHRPPRHAHAAAALAIGVLQLSLLGQMLAVPEPTLATLQVVLVIGTAVFLLDWRWLLGVEAFELAVWLVAARQAPPGPPWQIARFVVLVGFPAAGAFHLGRLREFARAQRLEDERRRQAAASREANEALRASEAQLQAAQRIAHVGSYEWDLVTDRLIWSEEHRRIFGLEPDEPVDNARYLEAVHPDDRKRILDAIARSLRDGDPIEMRYRILRPDGQERVLVARGETQRDAAGRPIRHRGTAYDVTDLHRAMEDLRASEERLTAILTAMDSGRAVLVGRDGTIGAILGEPEHTGRYGVGEDEVPGRDVHAFLPGDAGDRVLAAVQRVYASGEDAELEVRIAFPKGDFHFDVSLRPLRSSSGGIESVVAITRDVTERHHESELRRTTQKLESLGILAGGVAHDFNNLLVGILSNAELAISRLAPGQAGRAEIEDIYRSGTRAAELTRELLSYAGGAPLAAEPVDLAALVADTAELLRPNLPETVRIVPTDGHGSAWARGDPVQLRQVIMNFIMNAAEAMQGAPGAVEIRVEAVEIDRAYLDACFLREDLEPGTYTRVEVCDRGVGMAPETLERVFDPFFTTKFQGRGLGLASTVGIVRAHGGTLRVESELGRGTCFAMLLPRIAPETTKPEVVDGLGRARGERILVVDDEDLVRVATERLLVSAGYGVLAAASGSEAMEVLRNRATRIDLAVVDMTMPELNGEETCEALRGIDPRLPVLFMSGHSSEEVQVRIAGMPRTAQIAKPFRRSTLCQAVASLLERRDELRGAERAEP